MAMKNWQSIFDLVLKAVALAMGVAVVVLSVLGSITPESSMFLVGLGLAALALSALDNDTSTNKSLK